MSCDWHDRGAVELAFYGELDAAERERFDAHLAGCGSCRAALEELDAIAHALDARRHEASPPGGDWSPFMARLDAHLGREVTRRSRSSAIGRRQRRGRIRQNGRKLYVIWHNKSRW